MTGLTMGILASQGGFSLDSIMDSLQVETDGWVISGKSVDYPSFGEMLVRDTVTPANVYSGPLTTEAADIFTYTSPSPKMIIGTDGLLKFAAHNLLIYSEDLSAGWPILYTTVSGDIITADAGDTIHSVYNVIDTVAGCSHRISARCKAGTSDFISLAYRGAKFHFIGAVFDLANGVIGETKTATGSGTIVSTSITDVGNGYYDCEVVGLVDDTSGDTFAISMPNSASGNTWDDYGNISFNAAGTETVEVNRMQLSRYPCDITYLTTTTDARYAIPIDHTDSNNPAIQIEASATNLIIYSRDLGNAAWVKSRVTVMSDATIGPSGELADKLVEDATPADTHSIRTSAFTATSGITYTFSAMVKAGERNWIELYLANAAFPTDARASFDLTNGVVGSLGLGADSHRITPIGNNGWYLCEITGTAETDVSLKGYIYLAEADDDIIYDGDGFSGVYIDYTQIEVSSLATSRIPTLASTVTRAKDDIQVPLSNFPTLVGGGYFTWEAVPRVAVSGANPTIVDLHNGTPQEQIFITASDQFNLFVKDNNVTQADIAVGTPPTINVTAKGSGKFVTNDFQVAIDGISGTPDTSGTLPTLTTFDIGQNYNSIAQGSGINFIKIVNRTNTTAADHEAESTL